MQCSAEGYSKRPKRGPSSTAYGTNKRVRSGSPGAKGALKNASRPLRARPSDRTTPINKIVTAQETASETKYLVRWDGFAREHDSWLTVSARPELSDHLLRFEAHRGKPQQIVGQVNLPRRAVSISSILLCTVHPD